MDEAVTHPPPALTCLVPLEPVALTVSCPGATPPPLTLQDGLVSPTVDVEAVELTWLYPSEFLAVSVNPVPSDSGSHVAEVPPAFPTPSSVMLRWSPFPAVKLALIDLVVRAVTVGAPIVSASVVPVHAVPSDQPPPAELAFCVRAVKVLVVA